MDNPLFNLAGKVALVTGANAGLGFEIARGLAISGADVVLHGRDQARLHQAITRLRSELPTARLESCPFDLSVGEAVTPAIAGLIQTHGRMDILVNNAGARDRRPLDQLDRTAVRHLLEIDLIAPMDLARQVARHMPHGGRIINITSIAGPIANKGDAAYTAAKGGLEALTRALAAELGPGGITVNAVAPGFFATDANRAMVADERLSAYLAQRTSLGRWGDPGEIAGAVIFLASGAASYITGHVLAVDGGYLAHF